MLLTKPNNRYDHDDTYMSQKTEQYSTVVLVRQVCMGVKYYPWALTMDYCQTTTDNDAPQLAQTTVQPPAHAVLALGMISQHPLHVL